MRILLSTEHLEPHHGIAVSTQQIGRELARRGHKIYLAYTERGSYLSDYESFVADAFQIKHMRIPRARPWEILGSSSWRLSAMALLKPDVVYDHTLWGLPWSYLCAKLSRSALVAHMHGFVHDQMDRQQKSVARGVDRFIAVSHFAGRRLVAEGVPEPRIDIAYNGIDPGAYPIADAGERRSARRSLNLRDGSYVVLFLGRIHESKGLDLLFRALNQTRFRPETELLLVGPGDPGYVSALRESAPGVRANWVQPRADVTTALHAADVLVLPAKQAEAFGRVVIEAMSTGLPAVATRSGGLPEVLTGEFARYLVDRDDPAELAQILDSARHWRTAEPDLQARCRQHVIDNFTLSTMVDRIENSLELAAFSQRRARSNAA